MAMVKIKNKILPFLLMIIAGFIVPAPLGVQADTMSSSSYRIQADSLNIGGGRSTSTSFVIEDSLGDLAIGEDLSSTSFKSCSGYECFVASPFMAFSVTQGTVYPGTVAAGVNLGIIPSAGVATSNGTSINSIFVTTESNGKSGVSVTVRDVNNGLVRASVPSSTIPSGSATLTAGTAGYGVCVFSVTQHAESPTVLAKTAPYNGTCTKTTGHAVGLLDTTNRQILNSPGALKSGQSEILVKAAISSTTPAGGDYQDTLTFIAAATF